MKTLPLLAVSLLVVAPSVAFAKSNLPYRLEQSPYATYIAQKTGDILTVVVDEEASTEDNGDTKLKRDNNLAAELAKFYTPLFDPTWGFARTMQDGTAPGIAYKSKSDFEGKATNTADHKFTTHIQVRMIEEIRPGEFVVRGYRIVNINCKQKKLFISGVVRQRDICADNSVKSHKLVDATVEIEGDVAGKDIRPGCLTKIFNAIF